MPMGDANCQLILCKQYVWSCEQTGVVVTGRCGCELVGVVVKQKIWNRQDFNCNYVQYQLACSKAHLHSIQSEAAVVDS